MKIYSAQFLDVYVAVHDSVVPLSSPAIAVKAGNPKELFLPFVLNGGNMVEEVIFNCKT
jgi:hypothetical protein